MAKRPDTGVATPQRQVRDAYGLALGLLLLSTIGLIFADAEIESLFAAAAGLLQLVALVVTLRVSGVGQHRSTALSAAGLAVFAAAVIAVSTGGTERTAVGIALWLALAIMTIVAIVRRLVTYRRVNVQLVLGLLSIHVLTGLSFGLAYLLVDSVGVPAFAQGPQGLSGSLYFSFVTLTTLGFGDLSPGSSIVRALSVAEAFIGQLYLVSVVAFAVGRLGTSTSSRR